MRKQTNFDILLRGATKIADNAYILNTVKRQELVIPDGLMIYDQDENQWYVGDSSTSGGIVMHSGDTITLTTVNATTISGANGTFGNISVGTVSASGSKIYVNDIWRLQNSGVVWDDMKFPFTSTRRGALSKPDFDYDNIGLLFPQNDATEKTYAVAQFPHSWKIGSDIVPHVHWVQRSSGFPTWKMDYAWYNLGQPSGAYTTLSASGGVFSYTTGNIGQITSFGTVTPPSGVTGVSSMMKIKVYRDDNVVVGDVLADEFDIHIMLDSHGSDQQYTKS